MTRHCCIGGEDGNAAMAARTGQSKWLTRHCHIAAMAVRTGLDGGSGDWTGRRDDKALLHWWRGWQCGDGGEDWAEQTVDKALPRCCNGSENRTRRRLGGLDGAK